MNILGWLARLFRRDRPVTEDELHAQLIRLDQQQFRWTERARRAEQLKNEAFLRGTRSADPREKLACARQVSKLDRDMKQFDANAAVLEQRKSLTETWIRRLQAEQVAPTRSELLRAQAEIEQLALEDELAQKELERAGIVVGTAETGRLEATPQEAQDVQDILRAMEASKGDMERKPGISEGQKE